MSGKLNIEGKVSVPIVLHGTIPNGVDSIVRQDYDDIEIVFINDVAGTGNGYIDEYARDIGRPYTIINTTGPSLYTPNGWQLPLILGIGETTGDHVFIWNDDDLIPAATIGALVNEIGTSPAAVMTDNLEYNSNLHKAIVDNALLDLRLNGPMLIWKEVYYRRYGYLAGQFYYMRFLQIRLWCEGDIVCINDGYGHAAIEALDLSIIKEGLIHDGYKEEDIARGGKYWYGLHEYELEDISRELCARAGIEFTGVLNFLRDINYSAEEWYCA